MKTLYRNCRIYDGTGGEPFEGEILVDGDKLNAEAAKTAGRAIRV
ncbi:MAG: hypothetical protein PUC58_02995 [Oscillospiraceae bacterium]|nr:hypothetical protein [Oscillospiraceae bacterium]